MLLEEYMTPIDLRSDTVTKPTPEMREAMARAEVGDDVYGEDPTVNRLQEIAAAMLGKEAGLFVPSGTMGNLSAILAHCGRGDEMIVGHLAHTFLYEAGGASALGGVHSRQVLNQPDGTLQQEELRLAIRGDDAHYPVSRLITLENTHNRCGGVSLSKEYTQAVGQIASEYGLRLHLDGARIFNAAAAQKVPAAELAAPADSVTFCLSKGLAAPVGSVLCGERQFIYKAHRIRKQLGGGMRQVGILAAAGLVALESMVARLSEDHARAQRLAHGLGALPGLLLDAGTPYTNMIFCALDKTLGLSAQQAAERLGVLGVKVGVVGAQRFRLVTHFWITDADVDTAVGAFEQVLRSVQ
jgi:threonine aldolase